MYAAWFVINLRNHTKQISEFQLRNRIMPAARRRPKTYSFSDVTICVFDVHISVDAIIAGSSGFRDRFRFLADAGKYRDTYSSSATIKTKSLQIRPLAHRVTGVRGVGETPKKKSNFWNGYLQIKHDGSTDFWKQQLPFVVRPIRDGLVANSNIKGVKVHIDAAAYLNTLGWSTTVRLRLQGKIKANQLVDFVDRLGSNDRSPLLFNGNPTTLTGVFRFFENRLTEEVYSPDQPPHPKMAYPRRFVIALNSYSGPFKPLDGMSENEKNLFSSILYGKLSGAVDDTGEDGPASQLPESIRLRKSRPENFAMVDFQRGILVFPQYDADIARKSTSTVNRPLRPQLCHAENTRAFFVAFETIREFLNVRQKKDLDGGLFPVLDSCVRVVLDQFPERCWNQITHYFHHHRKLPLPKEAGPVPLKTIILFLASNPDGVDKLALDKECRKIREKIRAANYPKDLELKSEWAVRPDDLLQYLNEYRPHVVHFSGHGSSDEQLILHDDGDQPKPVSKPALRSLFKTLKDNVRLVVLNACYSSAQAKVIVENIDCAVGMKKAIGDDAAIVFAGAFYRALGFAKSVKAAFDEGCVALQLEGIPEEKTPVLHVKTGVDANKVFLAGPSAVLQHDEDAAMEEEGAPQALAMWKKRLNAFQVALAKESDAAAKFKLQEEIEEAKAKIRELGGST